MDEWTGLREVDRPEKESERERDRKKGERVSDSNEKWTEKKHNDLANKKSFPRVEE